MIDGTLFNTIFAALVAWFFFAWVVIAAAEHVYRWWRHRNERARWRVKESSNGRR